MSDKGKALEAWFRNECKSQGIYCHRFLDARSVGDITQPQPADFFVYLKNQLFFIECKDSSKDYIEFRRFTQVKELLELKKKYSIQSYVVVRFYYNNNRIYFIEVEALYNYIMKNINNVKSLTDDACLVARDNVIYTGNMHNTLLPG